MESPLQCHRCMKGSEIKNSPLSTPQGLPQWELAKLHCLLFSQTLIFLLAFFGLSSVLGQSRRPASGQLDNDISPYIPKAPESWTAKIWVEDRSGVMSSIRSQFDHWEKVEEYREQWNLESTNLFITPDRAEKIRFFRRGLRRYLDKRITGEIKHSQEGSGLHRVKQIHQALRPSTSANIGKSVKIKFKARLLQAEGRILVDNPWVRVETFFNLQGQINVQMRRNIASLGLQTGGGLLG